MHAMPRFFYFDLGNVLLYFDHRRACRQVAEVAGVSPERVWEVVFASGLEDRYEAGQVSTREFYETFCRETRSRPPLDELAHAASAIFEVNCGVKAVLAQLAAAGCRLGLLSNTNEIHWNYFAGGRYALIPDVFEVLVLSFRVGVMKPQAGIFRAAAEMAGVEPGQIFYVDDVPGHVTAARQAGFDAVQYTTTPALVEALWQRGVAFNY
jgi:putative hydrolase of the HAD superfamily